MFVVEIGITLHPSATIHPEPGPFPWLPVLVDRDAADAEGLSKEEHSGVSKTILFNLPDTPSPGALAHLTEVVGPSQI
jgi:hypothetical protein